MAGAHTPAPHIHFAALIAIAEKASAGPWCVQHSAGEQKARIAGPPDATGHQHTIAKIMPFNGKANRRYFQAFDPQTVLALIRLAEQAVRDPPDTPAADDRASCGATPGNSGMPKNV